MGYCIYFNGITFKIKLQHYPVIFTDLLFLRLLSEPAVYSVKVSHPGGDRRGRGIHINREGTIGLRALHVFEIAQLLESSRIGHNHILQELFLPDTHHRVYFTLVYCTISIITFLVKITIIFYRT
ncbi:hypothetical protein FQZ97_1081730 [compost metagenome]